MSLGIGLEESTLASKGKDIFLSKLLDNSTAVNVTAIKSIDNTGFIKGIKLQEETLENSQNGLCHHAIGMSCIARIRANGK